MRGYLARIVPVDPEFSPGDPPERPHPSPLPPGPTDPAYGIELPPVATHPIVPGSPPEHVWWGGRHRPIDPGYDRPAGGPGYPSGQPLPPTYPVDPDYGLPRPPHIWPSPPRPVDPGFGGGRPQPIDPDFGVPIFVGHPDHELPMPPGSVWPPLPPEIGDSGKVMVFVWIPGVGYRWTVIDTALKPTVPIYPPVPPAEPKS